MFLKYNRFGLHGKSFQVVPIYGWQCEGKFGRYLQVDRIDRMELTSPVCWKRLAECSLSLPERPGGWQQKRPAAAFLDPSIRRKAYLQTRLQMVWGELRSGYVSTDLLHFSCFDCGIRHVLQKDGLIANSVLTALREIVTMILLHRPTAHPPSSCLETPAFAPRLT